MVLQPTEQERRASMNSVLVTMAPAIEALTSVYWPAFNASAR